MAGLFGIPHLSAAVGKQLDCRKQIGAGSWALAACKSSLLNQ